MEVERLRRLRRLTELLNKYQALPDDQRARSTKVLQWIIRKRVESEVTHELLPGVARELDSEFLQLTHEPVAPGSTPSTTRIEILQHSPIQNEISTEDAPILIAPRNSSQSLINLRDSTYEPSSVPETDEHHIEDEDEPFEDFDPATDFHLDSCGLVSAVQSYAIEPPDDLWTNIAEHNTPNEFEPSDIDGYDIHDHTDGSISQPDDIVKGLLSLYHDYHQSIPVVMTPRLLDPTASGVSEDADAGIQEQYAMSKSQVQLTLDEGNLWRSFADASAVDVADPQKKLESLSQKSETLSKSYERRNNAPTTKTYEESKLILQAMGVPCIEPDVPYEAEALAASLVHHGFADYVASEDTVRPST
jgi:flap endonuclease-1